MKYLLLIGLLVVVSGCASQLSEEEYGTIIELAASENTAIISRCYGFYYDMRILTNDTFLNEHYRRLQFQKLRHLGVVYNFPITVKLPKECIGLETNYIRTYERFSDFPLWEDDCIEGTPHCFVKWDVGGSDV